NKDKSEVIIIQNEGEQDRNIEITGLKENVKLTIEAHSISTIVL
ncbi:MAG TPA: hypothetical protein DDW82_06635, partial [Acholeplasmataceae bacterium]|nr:hypothetical protein [Acholeplasmataceae bacterium]